MRHIKGNLQLVDNAQPKFCKARSLPYSLRDKFEKEFENPEKQGIVKPVGWSEWATLIVNAVKKNGTVRLCGDFKITI